MASNGFRQLAGFLTSPIALQDMVLVNDRVVMVGGATDATGTAAGGTATIQVSRLQPHIAMTPFVVEATGLPAARVAGDSIISNGYLVQLGGVSTAGTAQNTIFVAPINSEGNIIGQFKTFTFPKATMTGHRLAAYGGYIYCIAGGAANTQEVYFSKHQADGSFGPWIQTFSLPQGLSFPSVTVRKDGTIFVTGGLNGTTAQNTVYTAKCQVDGNVNQWKFVASLAAPRWRHSSTFVGDRLYVFGGSPDNVANSALSSAEVAQVNSDATITRFTPMLSGLWTATRNCEMVLRGERITVIGGHDSSGNGQSSVQIGVVQADGQF